MPLNSLTARLSAMVCGLLLLLLARMVASLSDCGQVDSETLVSCLWGKRTFCHHQGLQDDPRRGGQAFLPRYPQELLAFDDLQPILSIISVNSDEYRWVIPKMVPPEFGDLMVEEYMGNSSDPQTIQAQFHEMMADFMFVVPALKVAQFQRSHAPVYFCEFQHWPRFSKDTKPPYVKADHGDEISFVFGILFWNSYVEVTEEEELLSRRMMKYWANFAQNGNPSGESLPHWPMFDQEEQYLQLNTQPTVGRALKAHRFQFWTKTLPQKTQEQTEAKKHTEL